MNEPQTSTRSMRLATWLLALIAACVLPLVAVSAWLAYQGVAAQHAVRHNQAADKARDVANAVDQLLRARIGGLQMLARSPLIEQPLRWAELYREAQAFEAIFGSHVVVIGRDEDSGSRALRMLLNTRVPYGGPLPPPLPRPQGRAALELALQSGQPAVGDLYAGPFVKELLVALAVPVVLPAPSGGRSAQAVVSTPEAGLFQRRLDQMALAPGWALSLLDSRGEAIARRAPPGFVAAPGAAGAGRHQVTLTQAPWTVVLEVPQPVLQAPVRQATWAMALAIGTATAMGVAGGLLAARRLRRAVAALAAAEPGPDQRPGIAEIDRARQQLDAAARQRAAALTAERAAEQQLRATFELANVGIAHVGLDGRWLRVNRKLCQIVGYAEADLLAARFQDITHADDLKADLALVQQLLAGEIPAYEMDKRYRHRQGGEVWVALAVALVRTAAGAPDFFISVVEDISVRKQLEQRNREQFEALVRSAAEGRRLLTLAERSRGALLSALEDQRRVTDALRASEAYRRRLFEQLADGVLLVDVDGRIHDANPRAEVMFGCAPGELTKLQLPALLHEAERLRLATEVPRMMAGPVQLTEWEQRRRDGTHFPAEVSSRPVDERRYVAVLRDISERRAHELELLQVQVELSELAQHLMAQERATTRRVAQALHDRLGQTLALARLRLGALVLRQGSMPVPARETALAQLGGLLEQAVAEARQVLVDLRPPLLEDQGLAAALDNELRSPALTADVGALPVLQATPAATAQRWPADTEYAAFMVAREAVANAVRHGQARHIVVRLDGGPQWLRLQVEDDGIGLAPALAQGRPGHLGIVGMRERGLAIGAHFSVSGQPGGGTCATLTWGTLPT